MKTDTTGLLLLLLGLPTVGLSQPSISLQPSDQSVLVGSQATFRVTVTGAKPPLSFQWQFEGLDLPQGTSATLLVNPARFVDRGGYAVVVTDASGSVTSRVARLAVVPSHVVHLGDRELLFAEPSETPWWEPETNAVFPHVTPDGRTLVFASDRPGGLGQRDLWVATREANGRRWGTPVNLGAPVNTPALEDDPFLSADGLELYFDSTRPGGRGDRDLWVATRPSVTAPFGEPVNLGPTVNSPAAEGTGCLARNGRTLLFASNRSGDDLWMSTRSDRGQPWSPATKLGAPINSASYETTPFLSADERTLFFMSDRHRPGSGSLWVSRRASVDAEFGPPALLQFVSSANPGGADFPMLSDDESTLYYNSYPDGFPGRTKLEWVSLMPVPLLRVYPGAVKGTVLLELSGREGIDYTLEYSPDLTSWTPWLTTNTSSYLNLKAPPAPSGADRFYRAVGR